jgi:hypothetical protein
MANHYLGFDLGHADTALALIGGRAIREASKAESGGARLSVAFKTRPKDLGAAEGDIRDFFATCLAEAAFTPVPPEGWAGVAVAVGCPSGWSAQDDIARYQAILQNGIAGTPMADAEITVVPESRAALLHAIDNPNSPLTVEARTKNILVIDVGSSTLDFSLIAPEKKASPLLDAGLDLGASFFDRQVLAGALENEKAARLFLDNNPHYKDLWLYYARRTKEQYFIDAPTDDSELVSGAPLQTYYQGGRRRTLEITVTGERMARYRNAPLDRPLHPSEELALDPKLLEGKSWEEIYRISLEALKEAILRRGSDYGHVLLAGGASRMPFTLNIAREVFEDGETIRVLRDPEPSHMVSRGLARWGRKRENVERFAKDARRLLKDRLPELVDAHFGALQDRLAVGLAEQIFETFVVPVLERWRDGAFRTGHDVRREIESRYGEWITSEEGSAFFVRTINGWWRDEVKHELDRELDRLHAAYDISPDIQLHFENAIDPDAFTFSARSIDLPFETVIGGALMTLAFALTLTVDTAFAGVPVFTGTLAAAVALGGRYTKAWISSLDVPAFARKLPDRLPGQERLFSGQARQRVEKELRKSLSSAKPSLLAQLQDAVSASIESQTKRARTLLMGSSQG